MGRKKPDQKNFMNNLTGPLSWPSDYLINIISEPPILSGYKVYICDFCCTEIKHFRWHTSRLNFDLCENCYDKCIKRDILALRNSRYKVCINDLKKISVS
jgi:hypothetical protein